MKLISILPFLICLASCAAKPRYFDSYSMESLRDEVKRLSALEMANNIELRDTYDMGYDAGSEDAYDFGFAAGVLATKN